MCDCVSPAFSSAVSTMSSSSSNDDNFCGDINDDPGVETRTLNPEAPGGSTGAGSAGSAPRKKAYRRVNNGGDPKEEVEAVPRPGGDRAAEDNRGPIVPAPG